MSYDKYRDHLVHYMDKRSWGAEEPPQSLTDIVGAESMSWSAAEAASAFTQWQRSAGNGNNGFLSYIQNLKISGSPGEFTQIRQNDDSLILFAGRATNIPSESSAIFRFGKSGTPTSPFFRIRMVNNHASAGVPLAAGSLIDTSVDPGLGVYMGQVYDDNGLTINIPGAVFTDSEDGVSAIAIDRNSGKIHSHQYSIDLGRSRYDSGDLPSADAPTLGSITMLNDDGGGVLNTFSLQNVLYGCAVYVFPNGSLPSDWRTKSSEIGSRWVQGNFEEAHVPQFSAVVPD